MKVKIQLLPSLIAWPFHKIFTIPYVKIGSQVTHTKWGETNIFDLQDGETISAGFSYWFNHEQRLAETSCTVSGGDVKQLIGRLGPFNSSPFHFKVM